MLRLVKHIILFLLPFVVLVLVFPVNSRLKYQGLKDDCFNHGIWIYDRIHNNEKAIDIVFLGSSLSINSIDDQAIEQALNNKISVANFGYCRLGMNLNYVLWKEVLKKKNPTYLILEVREGGGRSGHPIFPYIADSKDIILPNIFFNENILHDMSLHFSYKVDILQDMVHSKQESAPIRTNPFGFAGTADTVNIEILNSVRLKRSQYKTELSKSQRKFYMRHSRYYLKKINELCEKHNVELLFLYLPPYASKYHQPREAETYLNYGEILTPPEFILENPSHWQDDHHMNKSGAKEISNWLVLKLQEQN